MQFYVCLLYTGDAETIAAQQCFEFLNCKKELT